MSENGKNEAPNVYLAGPSVFAPNSKEIGEELCAVCAEFGLVGRYPADGNFEPGPGMARLIREANMALIRWCDIVVADMTPFRGPGMDGGTAYEMGAAAALFIPVVGYTGDCRSYAERVLGWSGGVRGADGVLRDADGMAIEDFGEWSPDNLMMGKGIDSVYATPRQAIARAAAILGVAAPGAADVAPPTRADA